MQHKDEVLSKEVTGEVIELRDTEETGRPHISFDDKNRCQFYDNNVSFVEVFRSDKNFVRRLRSFGDDLKIIAFADFASTTMVLCAKTQSCDCTEESIIQTL